MDLCHLTSFRMGGTPRGYYRPRDTAELRAALDECRRAGLSWRVLGGGTNLLVEEGDLPYAVIHIRSPGFDSVERTGRHAVRVGAGLPVARLMAYCRREGFGGLEFMAGLPGTVGGALAGNAGAWGGSIADRLRRLWLVRPRASEDAGERPADRPPRRPRAGYRDGGLDGAIVTAAEFRLEPRSSELVAEQMAQCVRRRAESQPLGAPSAGCVFKNPSGRPAGELLELSGMKGRKIGDAAVSKRHANFIVNRGHATSREVLKLIDIMRKGVLREFGVELELEVHHWPARGSAA
jgi:UDP-N-acetylmuramate dehydrogenase